MAKAPVTMIVGSDAGVVMKEADSLCRKWLGSKNEWNYVEYDADTANVDEILGDVFTPPFIGGCRVILVKQVTALSAAAQDKLVAAFGDVPEFVQVILTATSIDKRGKLYRSVKDVATVIDLNDSGQDLASQIKKMAAEMGLGNLPEEVIELLEQRSGGSLTWIDNELAKLAAYLLSSGGQLTAEIADQLISAGFESVSETAGFELLDLIASGDTAGAVRLLHRLLNHGQPALTLLGLLAWQYRMVVAAASLQAMGIPSTQVAQRVGQSLNMKSTPVRKAMRIAARLGYMQASRALELIFEAGYKARLGVYSFEQAVELLVIRLSRLGADAWGKMG